MRSKCIEQLGPLAFALAMVALWPAPPARANTIAVTTTADEYQTDNGLCSLREAVEAATQHMAWGGCPAGSGNDTITVPAGTYQLTIPNAGGVNEILNETGDLNIRSNLTLQGSGAGSTFIQAGSSAANGIDRVLTVNASCYSGVSVWISGVTIRYGRNTQALGANSQGGGLTWCGGGTSNTFTLSNAVVSDNSTVSGFGGGLYSDGGFGSVNLSSVTFQDNSAVADGGGVYLREWLANVTLSGCQVVGNTADGTGGGMFVWFENAGSVQIHGTTISGNTAGAQGGGLAVYASHAGAAATIDQGTIISNNVSGTAGTLAGGGGVLVQGNTLTSTPVTLSKVVVSGNSESPSATSGSGGGGILVQTGNVTVQYSRIVGNTVLSGDDGSGLYKDSASGTVTATNNWWGCSTGPEAAPCDTAALAGGSSGSLTSAPYLRMSTTADPPALVTNQAATVTASFRTNSADTDVSASIERLIGLPVAWALLNGDPSGVEAMIQSDGTATLSYQATAPAPTAFVAAQVDNDTWDAGNPNVATVPISKADTSVVITADGPDPSTPLQAVTVQYTVSGAYGDSPTALTGSVTVGDGVDSNTCDLPATSCAVALTTPGLRTLTASYGGDADFNSGSGTDPHDVTALTLTVDVIADQVAESAGPAATTVSVTRSGPTSDALMVSLSSSDPTEAWVVEIAEIPAGQASVSVDLDALDDAVVDGSQTVTIDASAPTFTPGSDTVEVTDDEVAGFSVSPATATVTEPDTTETFTVTLAAEPLTDVVLAVAASDETEAVVDPATLTFTPGSWSTPQPVTITAVDDVVVDGPVDSTVTVSVVDASSADAWDPLDDRTVAVTTADDDRPVVSIGDASTSEGDVSTTDLVFAVTLSAGAAVTVDWATADGTATEADGDYVGASGTLSFEGGETSKTVTVAVHGDPQREADETLTVQLSNIAGAEAGTLTGTGTIGNDDPVPQLAIGDASGLEGDAGTSPLVFTVSLSNPSDQPVTAAWSTGEGTAVAGTDYVAGSGQITIAAGTTATTLSVDLVGDTAEDGTSAFVVDLADASGATIADGQATGTILDDDAPFVVNSSADTNDGTCDDTDCTLREAIDAANVRPGADRILFGIGTGPVTIETSDPLPDSYDTVVLDGTSQPGWTQAPIVRVDGGGNAERTGLLLRGSGSTVKGLILTGFMGGPGLNLYGSGHTVTGCWVGVDETGAAAPNAGGVLTAEGGHTLGGPTAAARNLISSNFGQGVLLFSPGNVVQGNWIGVGPDGVTPRGNVNDGILINASGNAVGGIAVGAGNLIAHNGWTGVEVMAGDPARTGNAILGNVLRGNTILGIDLGSNWMIEANDTGDGDVGANGLQNHPDLELATSNGSATVVTGTLVSAPDGTYRVEIFSSSGCHPTGHGEAEVYLGATSVTADASGTAVIAASVLPADVGDVVTATATDAAGSTSELSACGGVTGVPSVSVASASIPEGTGPLGFPVTLSGPSAETVAVSYSLAAGTAKAGADYDAAGGVLTFAPGQTARTAWIGIVDDSRDEADETFGIDLGSPVHATLGTAAATGTIEDDDPEPAVSVADATATEGDSSATTMRFTVTLSAVSGRTVTVGFATAGGSATQGVDFTGRTGTLTFPPWTTVKTAAVTIRADRKDEADETLTLGLSGAGGATIARGTALGTILDNDPQPRLSIADRTVTETDSGSVHTVFEVTLNRASGNSVTVAFATADVTAEAGVDYQAAGGTLTFNPGQTRRTLTVNVLGDALDEYPETFRVDLSGALLATLADPQARGTITDDDPAPSLSIGDVTLTEGNTGTKTAAFNVTASAASGRTLLVEYQTVAGSAASGIDFVGKAGTLTFPPGTTARTIGIAVPGDTVDEPGEEDFFVDLGNPVAATLADGQGRGVILDNDLPPPGAPALSVSDRSLLEGDSGSRACVFTVSLSGPSEATVTVAWATADGTAQAGPDYLAKAGVFTFPPGDTSLTATVWVKGDPDVEPDETFQMLLSDPVNASVADGQGQGTIRNDDP